MSYRLTIAAALLLALIVLSPAHAGDLGTVTLIGQLNLSGNGNNTDVWGWVHPLTGREYALVGDNGPVLRGFQVIDCTDPSNPFLKKNVPGVYGFDVKARGQYVYTVSGFAGAGGAVVDLLDIANPVYYTDAFESSHNITIDPRGWLFSSAAGSARETKAFDLRTTPTSPVFAWDDNEPGGHDISIVGNRLYDFHTFYFTRIYDITNPAAPTQLGEIVDANIVYHHSGYPTEDGNYLFICDELSTSPKADITVWDISNLPVVSKVAEIHDSTSSVHNLYVVGDYAFVSYYTAGFKVFDVSDPTQPILADECDTRPAQQEEGVYNGAFGVYPFTQSGAIFVSDKQSGLYVFDFQPDSTSAVAITSFVAAYVDGWVRLEWSIGSADDLEGFVVYRSRERDRSYVRLNDELLPAAGTYRFDDFNVEPGLTYHYRMGAIDRDGEVLSQIRTITVPIRSVRLEQNFPNPFNPSTTIEYEIGTAGNVTLVIFDVRGREIRTLVDAFKMPGVHQAGWDGRDNHDAEVSTGVYFYRLSANGQAFNRRLALLK